ncbi:MAG: four helix bundle protein [Candidatus Omnitrophota bacterium]
MSKFRFEDIEIWQLAKDLAKDLFRVSDNLEKRRLYRFSEQLRASALSVANNIAEGSGSSSKKEFCQFLNIAKRSVFEVANMLIVFSEERFIEQKTKEALLNRLDILSRKIKAFQNSLLR